MANAKPILYGVSDFVRMRTEGAYYIDRTAYIRELEKTSYVMFLRPRRFGKSLLVSMLQCYYDVHYADRFDELFGGLAIHDNPTPEHGKYLILDFNFTGVEKQIGLVQDSFNDYCSYRIDKFAKDHAARLPAGTAEDILKAPSCNAKLARLATGLKGSKIRFMVLIDEYDNFTNTILAENGVEAYNALCHGEGFFKQFFNELKLATTGSDAPVTRLFITGVTPVTLDDVTSGFNIATNLSLRRSFSDFLGFTHADLRAMLAHYRETAGFAFDEEAVFRTLVAWYDHYRFSADADIEGRIAPEVCNTTLVLSYMQYLLQEKQVPSELVDKNLRTDYAKIRYLVTVNRRINGNYHRLEEIIAEKGCTAQIEDSFQARELTKVDNFVSLLFYFGLLAIERKTTGRVRLGIPNLTVQEFINDFIPRAYDDVYGIDSRVYDIANGLYDFSADGNWRKAIDAVSKSVDEYFKVRDAVEGERVVQTAMCSLLKVAHGPYIVDHEIEAKRGFADISFAPQLERYPDIGWAMLIELKYLKKEDDASPTVLAAIRAEAIGQLDRYAADHDIARAWGLGSSGGHVKLVRLVIVFQGGDRVLCEAV